MSKVQKIDPDAFEDPLSNYEPPEYESELERALAEDPVTTIQSQPFIHVEAHCSVHEATRALYDAGVSSLLVIENEKLVGIFTERDVLERVAEQFDKLSDLPVREVMTPNPTVIYEYDPVGTAVAVGVAAGVGDGAAV